MVNVRWPLGSDYEDAELGETLGACRGTRKILSRARAVMTFRNVQALSLRHHRSEGGQIRPENRRAL